jgi:tyrosyl-tRNA synthetase
VPQLRQFLDFGDAANGARLVDNRSWTVAMSTIDFLRDVGKHVTVNQMLAKESVKARIESEHGDLLHRVQLHAPAGERLRAPGELEGCEMQVGGSDQWGNISLGVDLVRRRLGRRSTP